MYKVYVLKSVDNYRGYVGITENLDRRIVGHNSGKTKSTKGYRPWELFFFEEYPTRIEARGREKYLKSAPGRRWMKTNINWPSSSTG